MGVDAVSLIVTVLLLNLYHHSDSTEVPNWLKTIVCKYIATVLCFKCTHSESKVDPSKEESISSKIALNNTEPVDEDQPTNGDASETPGVILPDYLRTYIQNRGKREKDSAISDENRSCWQTVARIMDRLFLLIYIIVIISIGGTTYAAYVWFLNCGNNL